jgi:hypothetical protein
MLKSIERFPKNLLFGQKRQPEYGSNGGIFAIFQEENNI